MDTTILVNERIDEGEIFISRLKSAGFDVVVAFWVLTSEEELWFLYIASSVVANEGLAASYRRAYRELSHSPTRWLSRSDIRLIDSNDPLTLDAIAYQRDTLPTKYEGRKLGNMIVEEAYIYPK